MTFGAAILAALLCAAMPQRPQAPLPRPIGASRFLLSKGGVSTGPILLRPVASTAVASVPSWFFPFAPCGNTAAGENGETVTVVRANANGTYQCSGLQTAAANTPRVEADGILVEPTSTEYFTNSCTNVVSQGSISLTTGQHYSWTEGTGSIDIAAGTATASGLPCTVTSGSHCEFNVTVAGTVATTVTGTAHPGSLQKAVYRMSRVCTTSPATRNVDKVSIENPITVASDPFCISETLKPGGGRAWHAITSGSYVAAVGSGTSNVLTVLEGATPGFSLTLKDAVPTTRTITYVHDYAAGSSHTVTACAYGDGTGEIASDGVSVKTGTVGSLGTMPGTIHLGALDTGGTAWAGNIKDVKICKASSFKQCLPSSLAGCTWANKVAALGDSITFSVGTTYPIRLNERCTCTHQTVNLGVAGNTVSQMLDRYRSTIHGASYQKLVLLGGINDIMADATAVATYATITTIVTEALADGLAVTLLSVLPAAGVAGWTGAMQTQLEALNALILGTPNVAAVDAYAAFGEPGNVTFLAAAYDGGDHLHPNQAGASLLATTAATGVCP